MSPNDFVSEGDSFHAEPTVELSIYKCFSVATIHKSLSALHTHDSLVTFKLQTLFASKVKLFRELGRLDLLRAHLSAQVINTRDVSKGMLDTAAVTASHLSNKVKELDLEKKRVEETLRVVEQVVELKACVQGVVGCMGAPQDWEAAAGYISRASRVPEHIVNGEFATRTIPSAEIPEPPGVALTNAKDSLCALFLREFEKAVKENDGSNITRFFKLFPLIKKEDSGLHAYGKYICQGIASRVRDNLKEDARAKDGTFYATALARLFEHIAQIIEGHGGLVERHYGNGMMIKVIERLQKEADVQGGIILDMWCDERKIERKLKDVKNYSFPYLVQSFIPGQKNLSITRTSSPGLGVGLNGSNFVISEDQAVDMREIDGILNEMALMLARWSLYSRFLAGKCKDAHADSQEPLVIPSLLFKSILKEKVSLQLISPFNLMTTFFFRRSVEKAFQLDELPSGLHLNVSKPLDSNPPFIISAVDDIMYIVSTVLQRALSTCQKEVISSVLLTIGRVLASDFVGMIQRKMRDEYYPKPIMQGGFPPEEKIVAFIVLINSLDIANEYLSRIITSRLIPLDTAATLSPCLLKEFFPFDDDFKFVTTLLENLRTNFISQSTELHSDGLHVMFNQVIRPRFRPVLVDTFRDLDYVLSEDDLANITNEDVRESSEIFQELVGYRFEHGWDAIMKPIQRIMCQNSFLSLLEQTARHIAHTLEKRAWGLKGKINALGALRMEKDFFDIIRVVAQGGRYVLREAFVRVTQICMIANMEDEEWEALTLSNDDTELVKNDESDDITKINDDKIVWVLDEVERKKARELIIKEI